MAAKAEEQVATVADLALRSGQLCSSINPHNCNHSQAETAPAGEGLTTAPFRASESSAEAATTTSHDLFLATTPTFWNDAHDVILSPDLHTGLTRRKARPHWWNRSRRLHSTGRSRRYGCLLRSAKRTA